MRTPLLRLYDVWMTISRAMGRAMSFLLLTILWVLLFGPYAIAMKVITALRGGAKPVSYWQSAMTTDALEMERQF